MLEKFFSAPKTLQRFRRGISGPHVDTFAHDLERAGYAPTSAVRYIRGGCKTFCVSGVFRKDKENAYGREEQVGCGVG